MEHTIPAGTQTLAKGMDVVAAVYAGATTLSEVVEATGIGRSTAHRLLQLLIQRGWITDDAGTNYALGPALITYGHAALEAVSLTEVARDVMARLREQQHDTVHLGERIGDEVLYLAKLDGNRGAEMRSRVGGRMPLTRTGLGMALLLDADEAQWRRLYLADAPVEQPGSGPVAAFVERMRSYQRLGAAFDLEDNEIGIRCVAAPVRDARDAIVGALSITATAPYMPRERMDSLVPVMIRAARDVGRGLGRV